MKNLRSDRWSKHWHHLLPAESSNSSHTLQRSCIAWTVDNAGKSGQSGDGFLYSRCYVVGSGRQQYEATLKDPQQMPKSVGQWFESLLYVSQEAWSVATGNDQQDWDFDTTVSYETGSNKVQW